MYCSLTGQGINQTPIFPYCVSVTFKTHCLNSGTYVFRFRESTCKHPILLVAATILIHLLLLERTELSLDHHALRLLLHAHSLRLSPKTQDWMVRHSAGSYRSYCCCMMCFCRLLIVRTISPAYGQPKLDPMVWTDYGNGGCTGAGRLDGQRSQGI